MRAKWILFLLLFLCIGCGNRKNDIKIETIIEENRHYKIGINYPLTHYQKLDDSIEQYIHTSYQNFLKQQEKEITLTTQNELNIDYTFYQNKEMISITLFKSENEEEEIKTFNYAYKKDCFISLEKFVSSEDVYNIANTLLFKRFGNVLDLSLLKKNLHTSLFSIDEENLYLYYPPYSLSNHYLDTMIIDIPLQKLNIETEEVKRVHHEMMSAEVDLEKVNSIIDANKKVVALTFDDGPSPYTDEIISILKENDAVATFFILGNKVKNYAAVLKKSLEYGNELGNHTYNHKWLTKLKDEEIKKQMQDTQDIIYETLGYTPVLFRPSYGSINQHVRKDIALDVVLWNIDTMDWKYKSTSKIITRATANVEDKSIILMHETYERTKKALPEIIRILKEKDFVFVTISELKQIESLRKYNG